MRLVGSALALLLCPLVAAAALGWSVGTAIVTGWVISVIWAAAVGFVSGWGWRREYYRTQLQQMHRDFNARLGLDRIQVYLYTDDGLSVRDITPVDARGVPLLDADDVRAELVRVGELMARGEAWGYNTHRVRNQLGQRSRVTFEALRDRMVAAGLVSEPRQGVALEFTEMGWAVVEQAMLEAEKLDSGIV
jgi:hypothetical protein